MFNNITLHITDATILHSITTLLISTGKSDYSHLYAQFTQITLPFIPNYVLQPWREEKEEEEEMMMMMTTTTTTTTIIVAVDTVAIQYIN